MHKHLPYFSLLEALKGKGCPICNLVKKYTYKFMDSFLYEGVNDSGLRKELRNSLGFCNKHAWQLYEFRDSLGISIIYEDLISEVIEKLEKDKKIKNLKANRKCPICKQEEEVEKRYMSVFIDSFDDTEIKNSYKDSFGLCLPHLLKLSVICKDKDIKSEILKIELGKLKNLQKELKEFQRKQDYKYNKEKLGKEKDSWIRAVEKLGGK
jgi:hypothetical protein